MYFKEIARNNVGWIDLSEEGQMEGCCEIGNESMCFIDYGLYAVYSGI